MHSTILRILAFGLLLGSAAAQTRPLRVRPDTADLMVKKRAAPIVPYEIPLTRISGVVIFEVLVSERGIPTVRQIISGHPMLIKPAQDALAKWQYEPFLVDNKAVPMLTFVAIPVNQQSRGTEERAQRDIINLHHFWGAADDVREALLVSDFDRATKVLRDVEDWVQAPGHYDEKWFWNQAMGQVSEGRNDLSAAQRYYLSALEVYKDLNEESSKEAATHASLGQLYLRMQKFLEARKAIARAVEINQKSFRRVDAKHTEVRQALGEEIGYQATLLAKLARAMNDAKGAEASCRIIRNFSNYVKSQDKLAADTACGEAR
jgi:tetratricopeptide (TPR) repeat protein